MQSLRKRLNGNKEEVLRNTELYGWGYAMDKYGVKDYLAFGKFIEAETGNPNFGRNPTFSPNVGKDLGEQILDAMLSYILKSETEVKLLRGRIEHLEWQLKRKGIDNREKISSLLVAVKA